MTALLLQWAAAVSLTAASSVAPFPVDIHIPVGGTSYDAAVMANAFLNQHLGSKEIDFGNKHTPHVTLYLTQWSCPSSRYSSAGASSGTKPLCTSKIEDSLAGVMYELFVPGQFGPCPITLSAPYAAGLYAMMNVTNTPCLQRYSDLVVNHTHSLSQPNQTVCISILRYSASRFHLRLTPSPHLAS
jgi:hypothetical protein